MQHLGAVDYDVLDPEMVERSRGFTLRLRLAPKLSVKRRVNPSRIS